MTIIESIITSGAVGLAFAFLFVFDPYIRIIDKYPYKPFSCVLCSSFWFSMVLYLCVGVSPLYAFYTAFIAEMAYRKLL
jgi:hypothetical protein